VDLTTDDTPSYLDRFVGFVGFKTLSLNPGHVQDMGISTSAGQVTVRFLLDTRNGVAKIANILGHFQS
jgi:hypothetical protein